MSSAAAGRECRAAVGGHRDLARRRQIEVAGAGMHGVQHRGQRRGRHVTPRLARGPIGVHERVGGRPGKVALEARGRVRHGLTDLAPDGHDGRRPLLEQRAGRRHVGRHGRVGSRVGTERADGEHETRDLGLDLRTRPVQLHEPDQPRGRAGQDDGRVAVVLREQHVADEHGVVGRVDQALHPHLVERSFGALAIEDRRSGRIAHRGHRALGHTDHPDALAGTRGVEGRHHFDQLGPA